jgi:hypothetical protein
MSGRLISQPVKGDNVKRFSWGAVVTIALGALIVLAPYGLFPVCEAAVLTAAGGSVPMKCFWTARASLGNGGLAIAAGFLLLFAQNPGLRLGLASLVLAAGLLTVLAPTALIGVCRGETMPCHMGTLPALMLLGSLTMLAGAAMIFKAKKAMAGRACRGRA